MEQRYGIISADSHTYEGPKTYVDYIDPKHKDWAPYVIYLPLSHPDEHPRWRQKGTHLLIVPGLRQPMTYGLGLAAAVPPAEITNWSGFNQHPAAHDSTTRNAVQDQDGVDAEILFSSKTMNMQATDLPLERKQVIFQAYNRWLAEQCARWPRRLFGLAMCAMKSVPEAIEDFQWAKDNGCVGIMMAGEPPTGDYDDRQWDPVWECAQDLGLPLAFHTSIFKAGRQFRASARQQQLNAGGISGSPDNYMAMPRDIQDLTSVFVLGGVLERFPRLTIVPSEGDASWIEHLKYRLDKSYTRYGPASGVELGALPSTYIDRQVYVTHQTDWVVFREAHAFNMDRIMWGSDYPHSDSTWPASPEFLRFHTPGLDAAQRAKLLRNNAIECYHLPLEKAPGDVYLREGGAEEYEKATGRPIDGPTFSGAPATAGPQATQPHLSS